MPKRRNDRGIQAKVQRGAERAPGRRRDAARDAVAVPTDPQRLWHDGWEPVRRRRPEERVDDLLGDMVWGEAS